MELTWAGYRISLRVRRKEVVDTPKPTAAQVYQPRSAEHRREVDRQYLLASGCRHVGPTR